jgi:hypothetical protein
LATTPTLDPNDPQYTWVDHGIVIQSSQGFPYNTIDPAVTFDAQGGLWLVFGSYWTGIYLVQLDPATGMRISPNSPSHRLAWNNSIEAASICYKDGYYYLFVNWGSCCSGVNSTYNVRVGRSTQITGPYRDSSGVDMVDRGGDIFMRASGKFTGPGHIGVLAENGRELFSFHYYDANQWAKNYEAYGAARLGLAPLLWSADGWPRHTNEWSAVYDFQDDARDENNRYYGLLKEGARMVPDPDRQKALDLNGTNQYAWLPASVAYAQTVSAVVNWRGGGNWQRIFDFGVDSSKTFMLTPSGGSAGVLRCDLNPGGDLKVMEWDRPLPSNVWTHVAVTLDGSRGILYVNGSAVVTNTSMKRLPLEGAFQTNHLGRSKFDVDPYFNGRYARFSVHSRALSQAEIVAPVPRIDLPADQSQYNPGETIRFSGSATDFMAAPLSASSCEWSIYHINQTATNLVFGPSSGVFEGSFPATGSSGCYEIRLSASDGSGRQAARSVFIYPGTNWTSYYPFTSSGQDASNRFNVNLYSGAGIQNDPTRGNVLNFSGSQQFGILPRTATTAQTISMWLYWRGGNAWQRLFDFGVNNTSWFHFTMRNGSGLPEVGITTHAKTYNRLITLPAALPLNQWIHFALVADGRQGILYINGEAVAVNNSFNLLPSDVIGANAYLAKSQYSADPYFNGRIDALKLSSAALPSEHIFAPAVRIIAPSPGSLFAGDSIFELSGEAFDYAESPMPGSALNWRVELLTNGEPAGVVFSAAGNTAAYAVPATGPLTTNLLYQVSLSATDPAGNAADAQTTLSPRIARLSFQTVPEGLSLSLDGTPIAPGASLDLTSGYHRTLTAQSPQSLNGVNYDFVMWSDGGPATHQIKVPITNTVFTASYLEPMLSSVLLPDALELRWPSWAQSLHLYSTTNLSNPQWEPDPDAPVSDDGMVRVQVPLAGPGKFYRLQ